MADRYPLIANSETNRIEELAPGDNLNLENNSIVGVKTVTAQRFIGNLSGTADFSNSLISANNILSGTISPDRLSGYYPVTVGVANSVNASGIVGGPSGGIVPQNALGGNYNINISGTAQTANYLQNAANIREGILSVDRLSGVYNISITGSAFNTVVTNEIGISKTDINLTHYIPFFSVSQGSGNVYSNANKLVYNPGLNRLGVGTSTPTATVDVVGDIKFSGNIFGVGTNLSGIVTQITAGIGVDITPSNGRGNIKIDAYRPTGKTIFVSQNGNDNNTGLSENNSKRTIKAAASIAIFGDTIKVYPGVYIEENPVILKPTVSVEGTELRNCVITPQYPERDLFHVNNGCHITDVSFIGPEMSESAAVVAFQPLLGVATDRYFDAARMIRLNLDYIASESVGFLTSGFSGFAGNHREQDAARLLEINLDFLVGETVGFLTSSDYDGTASADLGIIDDLPSSERDQRFRNDIKKHYQSIIYDLKSGGNLKIINSGKLYYDLNYYQIFKKREPDFSTDNNFNSIQQAGIDALNYSIGIATHIINNQLYSSQYTNLVQDTTSYSPVIVSGGCTEVNNKITNFIQVINNIIGIGTTSAPPEIYGVTLESKDCADDVKDVWKCIIHDITRGGNSRSVDAGRAYYDDNWNLIPGILKNPQEKQQTVATLDYSFNIARSVVNNCTWGGYPVGLGTSVVNAVYNNATGVVRITANNHGLSKDDAIKLTGLGFTCPSDNGATTLIYPTGSYGYIFPVKNVVGVNTFDVVVGVSTLEHTYVSGGKVQKYQNFSDNFTQVKDLSMQVDGSTGFNNAINGCANVISALRSSIGIVTTIVGLGSSSNITKRYPGNAGIGFTTVIGVTSAVYDNTTGRLVFAAPNLKALPGDLIEIRDLSFSCSSPGSGISTQRFPSGKYGYEFYIDKANPNETYEIVVGVSTLAHNYVSGGVVVDRSLNITNATYNNTTGIAEITAPNINLKVGDFVKLRDMQFSCTSGTGTTTIYPTGNNGYEFKVLSVQNTGLSNSRFTVNVGVSTIPHTYVSGGKAYPPYSKGVGPITQGPYVRNATNFIPKSIGMKIDGFDAEPGDKDDIGVTGTMSVDSYTQYNQGGIGVSITNGAYAQLVSIFTICNDIAVFTGTGGQCDITNSNSSFGRLGLYASGVGDENSNSIYRSTGVAYTTALEKRNNVVVSGVGNYRPYDGQVCYFGELFYFVDTINVIDGGSGYTAAPRVTISPPDGPNGITAQATTTIQDGKVVSVNIVNSGSQYRNPPNIIIAPPTGPGTQAISTVSKMEPIYYKIDSATVPSAGISTISLLQNLNNTVSAGTTVYFSRVSLQITSSHSFEWVGSGNDINKAKPALGGVVVPENEVVQEGGGLVVYTSTDQAGNFKIGDGVVINQATGQISGRDFTKALFTTMTPFILALSE